MIKKKFFWYSVFCFAILCMVPNICAGGNGNMELLASIDISATPRHEGFPSISYNPIDNEFMVIWHTSGKMTETDTQSYHSIDGRRISPNGAFLGDQIQLSAPEVCGWEDLPKSAYNLYNNEYMVTFQYGPIDFWDQEIYITKIDDVGNMELAPHSLYQNYDNAYHPLTIFNSQEREYLIAYNDTPTDVNFSDNLGFIMDEDGNRLNDVPFGIGNPPGIQYNPQATYNSADNTYLVVWEDFRHVQSYMENCDIYGSLLNADGNMIREIPVIDDYGLPDEGSQNNQNLAYNPDKNEFLVCWGATNQPSLEYWGGVVGRFVDGDGILKGEPFVIVDEVKPQNSPQLVYVKEKKMYFIVWSDYRNDTVLQPGMSFYEADNSDIYGKWLNPDGTSAGPDIPICTAPGLQAWPTLDYNPVMDRLLIAWWDRNAPNDYEPVTGGGGMVFEMKSDTRGAIYGAQSFLSGRVINQETGTPVEGAKVLVVRQGPAQKTGTNIGGWFNLFEDSQPHGKYMLVVSKPGYKTAHESLYYEGEPLTVTIEINKRRKK